MKATIKIQAVPSLHPRITTLTPGQSLIELARPWEFTHRSQPKVSLVSSGSSTSESRHEIFPFPSLGLSSCCFSLRYPEQPLHVPDLCLGRGCPYLGPGTLFQVPKPRVWLPGGLLTMFRPSLLSRIRPTPSVPVMARTWKAWRLPPYGGVHGIFPKLVFPTFPTFCTPDLEILSTS
jgi:hypothetical protein